MSVVGIGYTPSEGAAAIGATERQRDLIDRPYGHHARDGREHAVRLRDELSAWERPRWTLVDAAWTPKATQAASGDNGSKG